jgi:hypothetical protein
MCGLTGTLWAMGGKQKVEGRGQKAETKSEPAKEKSKKIVEPVLVWEKTFDEEIVDVIFGEAEMTVAKAKALGMKGLDQKKTTEKVKVVYPKVVVTNEAIRFLNEKGEMKKSISISKKLRKVMISKNGKNISITRPLKYDKYGHWIKQAELKLLDEEGNVICWSDKLKPEENHLYYDVLGNGESVVIYSVFTGVLAFYNRKDSTLKFTKAFVPPYSTMNFWTDYSYNGEYYVMNIAPEHKQGRAMVILFDKKGNELWRDETDENFACKVAISSKGNYVAIMAKDVRSQEKFIYLYNNQGELIGKRRGKGIISFSVDEKYYGITGGGEGIHLFDTKENKLLWIYKELEKNISFKSIIVGKDGNKVIVGGVMIDKKDFNNNEKERYLYIFNKLGELIFKKEFSGKGFKNRLAVPDIWLSPDERYITVRLPYATYVYQIGE